MTSITIDVAAIAARTDLRCLEEDATMRFMLQGETATVVALYSGGAVQLFPDRDRGHKKLLALLQP